MVKVKREEAVTIGKKLKKMRIELGKTQAAMGELVGISDGAWRQYELGTRIPNDSIKKRIALRFNKTVDELFF